MKIAKEIKVWLAPAIMALLSLKAVILGIGFPEALVFAFVSAIFGVEKYFFLQRLHRVEQRKTNNLHKELAELKSAVGMTRLQQNRAQTTASLGRMGDIPWTNNKST